MRFPGLGGSEGSKCFSPRPSPQRRKWKDSSKCQPELQKSLLSYLYVLCDTVNVHCDAQ